MVPVVGLPEIRQGDDLAALIGRAVELEDGDVVVVAQKIVSKAEGAVVQPGPGEDRVAARRRLVHQEAVRIVADAPWALIVETRHGLVCANAGIDASNVPDGALALLPVDPDASARLLRERLRAGAGRDVAVIVADTFGRPWRMGQTDVAIGVAGLAPLRDERGGVDRQGMLLEVTEVAIADEIAAAADLVRRKAEGVPVVVVRGLEWAPDDGASARALQRAPAMDLFPRGKGALADALAAPALISPGDSAPSADDARRVLAATRAAGRGLVDAVLERTTVVLRTDRESPDHLLALGAAGATVAAALLDLGWAGVAGPLERSNSGALRLVVEVGRPVAPERPSRPPR